MNTLTVGDLELEVRWSDRRRTIEITVDRGGELIIAAPTGCDPAAMETFVRDKRAWIYTKLAEKEALRRPAPEKRFVTGEGFPYLGRSYRLLLVDDQDVPLKLEHGRFRLRRAGVPNGREHLVRWYTAHAHPWISRRIRPLQARVGVAPSQIRILDLGYRWGSCGKSNTLNFHWRTILLPPRIIDYILVHELVHLVEPHHTPEFWRRIERALPGSLGLRERLAREGRCVSP